MVSIIDSEAEITDSASREEDVMTIEPQKGDFNDKAGLPGEHGTPCEPVRRTERLGPGSMEVHKREPSITGATTKEIKRMARGDKPYADVPFEIQ
jgi:hypothetical protein